MVAAPLGDLARKREEKASELPSFWPEESRVNRRKFSAKGAHLYPFLEVEGGVRCRGGRGKLLRVCGEIGQILLENETEQLPDSTARKPKYVARDFPVLDIFPSYVDTETINEYRRSRRATRI